MEQKVTKTKEQVLAEIMVKVISGQQLTADENKVLAENASNAVNTIKKASAQISAEAKKAEIESHKVELDAFIGAIQDGLKKGQFETGNQLKSWLRDQVKNCPVLKGQKGSGSTIGPKVDTRTDSYAGIVKKALIEAGEKGLTFSQLGEAIEKVKPETARLNSTGKEKLWEVYVKRTPTWFPNVQVTFESGKKQVAKNATYIWK